jgi:hypothetical protein
MAAFTAEFVKRETFASALRTKKNQSRAALSAELLGLGILRLAGRTLHPAPRFSSNVLAYFS